MSGCSKRLITASRKTIIELLQDRGYVLDFDIDDIHQVIHNHDVQISATHPVTNETKCVTFILQKRQVPTLKEYISKHATDAVSHIIITQHPVNKTFKTLCKSYDFENFNIHTLGINITHHSLVPQHTLLNEDDKIALQQELSLKTFEQLPIISVEDPISRYYGAVEGDVFKVMRFSKTAGEYTSYRYCTTV